MSPEWRGPVRPPMEDLRGEALRRAWIDASYRARQEPTMNARGLAIAISLAAVCWAIIGAGVWLVWRAF
jgi:hypothetical protein